MKEYPCELCNKIFDRKSNYITHINRKIPCINKTNISTPNSTKITPNSTEITPNKNNPICCVEIKTDTKINSENKNEKNDGIENNICKYCNRFFSRKFCLERHLSGRCKVKKEIDEFKELKEQNLEIKIQQDEMKKELIQLKEDNEKLKKQLKVKKNKSIITTSKSKPTTNTNINIVNNIVNNNSNNTTNTTNTTNTNTNIVNFNNMNYSNMDKKLFTNPLLNMKLFGKEIILKMVENIYINEAHPEYQNIIITDKNRGYVKVYNNGKWQTNNINTINLVLDGIIEHSKTILDELFEIYSNNNQVKTRLNTSNKYVKLCDPEHLAELEDEQEYDEINNKDKIKRCKDFREMVYKDTINLFHDNKNILLKPRINKIMDLD
jgi:hypothetical protein